VKYYTWSIAADGAGTWTLRKVDQKYLESYEMWCWKREETISLTNRVRNEVLHRVKEERNILLKIKRRKVNWIGHIFLRKYFINTLLKER
jgi:hypothetical protein